MFCVDFKKIQHSKRSNVIVEFIDGLSIQQITEQINQIASPEIIVWYIGCYGLRESGVQFYRNCLISPVLRRNSSATFWLTDLTAWNAFKVSNGSIHRSSSCCEVIDRLLDPRIKCIKSSLIFKKMRNLDDDLVAYFRESLRNDFIRAASNNFPNVNIRVEEIFSANCPVMADWYDCDVSKSYSVFQYLEGCLIVDEIFTQRILINSRNKFQILFVLPNDEIRYYRDEINSFQNDVDFLISKRCESLKISNVFLEVKFISFKYGSQVQHRPYNAPGPVLKSANLKFEDIADHDERIKNLQVKANQTKISEAVSL